MGNGVGLTFTEETTLRLLLDIRDLLSQEKEEKIIRSTTRIH